MVNFMEKDKAILVWNKLLLELSNPSVYQTYGFGINNQDNKNSLFIYNTDNDGKINIMSMVLEYDDFIKMPFGPIISEKISSNEILKYIVDISNIFKKDVVFTLNNEQYNDLNKDIEDFWIFKTPIINTSRTFEEFLSNCNQNRRRIFRKGLAFYTEECLKTGIEYLDEFYAMYAKRLSETNYPLETSKDYLNKILSLSEATLKVCKYDEKVIAGSIFYTFGDTIITRYNGFDSEYYKFSPISRIDYDNILFACNSPQIKNYDFSGLSDDPLDVKEQNINRYKESFGAKKIKTYNFVRYRR